MKTRRDRKHYQTRGMLRSTPVRMFIDMPLHAIVLGRVTAKVVASMPYTALARRGGHAVSKPFARAVAATAPIHLVLFCGSAEQAQAAASYYADQMQHFAEAQARSVLVPLVASVRSVHSMTIRMESDA